MAIITLGCSSRKIEENKTNNVKQDKLIVYGSLDCPHCVVFTESLDSAGIKYIFCEVDKDKALFNEMYQKIQKIKYLGNVSYPVIDINGKVLVNPEFNEIVDLIRR